MQRLFVSAFEKDAEYLLKLKTVSGSLPLLTCSKSLRSEFIYRAAQGGITRFIACNMEPKRIRKIMDNALRDNDLRQFMESQWPESLSCSHYIRELINEIIRVFPKRLRLQEFAKKLGINRGWMYKLCQQAFGMSLKVVLRQVWIYEALRIMQESNLDNIEIALLLNYSEESSLAREFRKQLGYNPNEARKRLNHKSPEELLHHNP